MRTITRLSLASVAILLAVAPGCRAVRAQVGIGLGVGADVQMFGLVHHGVLVGKYLEVGPNYGRPGGTTGYIDLILYHATTYTPRLPDDEDPDSIDHFCIGLFPGPMGLVSDEPPAEPWACEVGLALAFLELRLGFNPASLLTDPVPAADAPPEAPPAPAPRPEPRPEAATVAAPAPSSRPSRAPATTMSYEPAPSRQAPHQDLDFEPDLGNDIDLEPEDLEPEEDLEPGTSEAPPPPPHRPVMTKRGAGTPSPGSGEPRRTPSGSIPDDALNTGRLGVSPDPRSPAD